MRPWASQNPFRTQVVRRTLFQPRETLFDPRGILFEPRQRLFLFKLYKGIEFLSQTLISLSLYLCISMSETLDISNYESF